MDASPAGHHMPFTKYMADPEHIELMRTAFQTVCDKLGLSCKVDDPMTEIIVTRIVALSKEGERDADELARRVLTGLKDRFLALLTLKDADMAGLGYSRN
jgi:hypothetical protein